MTPTHKPLSAQTDRALRRIARRCRNLSKINWVDQEFRNGVLFIGQDITKEIAAIRREGGKVT